MKNVILILLIIFIYKLRYSKNDSAKYWIDRLSLATISKGSDDSIYVRENNGNVVKKRVFNIKGTDVIFYTK